MPVERFAVIPASYAYLLRDREVLLQRRQNTGYQDGMLTRRQWERIRRQHRELLGAALRLEGFEALRRHLA